MRSNIQKYQTGFLLMHSLNNVKSTSTGRVSLQKQAGVRRTKCHTSGQWDINVVFVMSQVWEEWGRQHFRYTSCDDK